MTTENGPDRSSSEKATSVSVTVRTAVTVWENEFEKASHEKPQGIVREFLQFLAENKKWWLLPMIIVLVLCSLMAIIALNGAPFIYTLF